MKQENFWRQVLSLALPVALQGLLYSLLGIVNQLMVGVKGEAAIVAVSLATKPAGVLNFIQMGLTAGLAILAAQHVGAKQPEKIGKLQGMILFVGLVVGLGFMLISLLWPTWAMRLFTTDSAVIALGVPYHQLYAWSYLPMIVISIYAAILRSAGIVKLPMAISLLTVPLEALLNYLLIFGHWGLPALGVKGSALATTIVMFIELLAILGLVYGRKLLGNFSLRQLWDFWKFDGEIKQLWLLTLPLLGDNLSFVLADTIGGAIYGFMGTAQTVAVTIMMPIQLLIITFFSGFGTAASVMIGHRLGRDELEPAYHTGKRILYLAALAPLALGGLLLLFMNPYLTNFRLSAYSLHLTQLVLILMVIFIPFKVVNMVLGSVLGAGGETKFIFYLSLMGGWIFAVPLGLLTAFVLHWPIDRVFVAVTLEEVIRVGLGLWKMRSRTWLNNLVKEPHA